MRSTFSRTFFSAAMVLLMAMLLIGTSFQALVREYLTDQAMEGLKNDGWSVWTVDECKQIHTYEGSFFKTKIIPDIVLQRNVNGEKQFLVLDAKYKRMRGEKIDVDRTDFFQIHTYMQYFQHLNLGILMCLPYLLLGYLVPLMQLFQELLQRLIVIHHHRLNLELFPLII